MKAKRVVLLGWDAADWKVIDQLIERGQMPALARMVKGGVRGNLSTLEPALSPMLWTSIATGKYADQHGIHGFVEPDYERGFVQPVSVASRKAKAVWNILHHQGYKSNVFSWWPSHPAEPINGVYVSNRYQRADRPINQAWPMTKGSVHPKQLTNQMRFCRIHPEELTEAHILPFIPDAAKVNQEEDKRIGGLSRMLADAATVHSASTWALEHTEWDFTAIYQDAIDHSCHGFMKFRPPKMPGIPDELFNTYQHVVDGMYRFHDMMLERIMDLVGEDTSIILISDHGFHSDHLRPMHIPKEPAGPAVEHRKHGIICCYGPDFKQNESIYGASIIDIAPTLLSLFGLPVGDDMDGTPLMQLFSEQPTLKRIPSWEDVEGDFGALEQTEELSEEEAKAAVQQLIELGYVEELGEDQSKALEKCELELQYNLSKVYTSTGRPDKALVLLESILEKLPEARVQKQIITNLKALARYDECSAVISEIRNREDAQDHKHTLTLMEADLALARGQYDASIDLLKQLAKEVPISIPIMKPLADCYIGQEEWKKAAQVFEDILKVDPTDASAYRGKALCHLRMKNHEEAVDAALTATELIFHYPSAHLILGQALLEMKEFEFAAKSLEIAQRMRPHDKMAMKLLDRIYSKHGVIKEEITNAIPVEFPSQEELTSKLDAQERKRTQTTERKRATRGSITIVSGLPRSGTSMMMQMLEAGGMHIQTDQVRSADENNPRGYYEDQRVKGLARNNKWLAESVDKVLKVVSPLLAFLSPHYQYKVVLMHREIEEVIGSQQTMLGRLGKKRPDTYPMKLEQSLKKSYENAKKWMDRQSNIEFLEISYRDVLRDPSLAAKRISDFLDQKLDTDAMVDCVDKTLHRTKLKTERQ